MVIKLHSWLPAFLFGLIGLGFFAGTEWAGPVGTKPLPLIMIDPGHGGIDGGCGDHGDILEKAVNLSVAQRLQRRLERLRLPVALTRTDDQRLARTHQLDMRARMQKARAAKARVLICLHADWSANDNRKGPRVYYHQTSKPSSFLAQCLQDELNALAGSSHRALPSSKLYVIREAGCPAVLVEMGFLSNPDEKKRLADPAYQEAVAEAIQVGLLQYLLRLRRLP